VHAISALQTDPYYLGQFTIMLAYILVALVVGAATLRRTVE
jgi:hypothetical protein